jgi:carboxyl-terminal processing protease
MRMRAWWAGLFVACVMTANADPAVDATTELHAAITILKTSHMNRDQPDWPSVTAKAEAMIAGAKTAADAYPAINFVIAALGEKHTFLMTASYANALKGGQASDANMEFSVLANSQLPEGLRLVGGIGYLRLPAHLGSFASDKAYVEALRTALAGFDAARVCRVVVDLRGNQGGNMWPMLNGLTSLLGTPPYGSFVAEGGRTMWDMRPAWMNLSEEGVAPVDVKLAAKQAGMPVAVLIGPLTGSSGEFTAMAFAGRPHTRFFGQPTAGYLTSNASHDLPDGARLLVSDSWAADRTGRDYRDTIMPDVATAGGQPTIDAALAWLKTQSCR